MPIRFTECAQMGYEDVESAVAPYRGRELASSSVFGSMVGQAKDLKDLH